MDKRILVVDDDRKICALVGDILKEQGLGVSLAHTTEEAWEKVNREDPDLIVLDVEIPLKGGIEFCREIKEDEATRHIPVIFLTVRDQEVDKVTALNMGGDDFITKPFRSKELAARVNVALRRAAHFHHPKGFLRSGSLFADFDRRVIQVNHRDVKLTPKEFDVFKLLYDSRHRVLSEKEVFDRIWGSHSNSMRSTVYTHVNRLRQKLKIHGEKIRTVPGVGFRFDERRSSSGERVR